MPLHRPIQLLSLCLLNQLQIVQPLDEEEVGDLLHDRERMERPPDQKSFQMLSIWFRISPRALFTSPAHATRGGCQSLFERFSITDNDGCLGRRIAFHVETQPLLQVVQDALRTASVTRPLGMLYSQATASR